MPTPSSAPIMTLHPSPPAMVGDKAGPSQPLSMGAATLGEPHISHLLSAFPLGIFPAEAPGVLGAGGAQWGEGILGCHWGAVPTDGTLECLLQQGFLQKGFFPG